MCIPRFVLFFVLFSLLFCFAPKCLINCSQLYSSFERARILQIHFFVCVVEMYFSVYEGHVFISYCEVGIFLFIDGSASLFILKRFFSLGYVAMA